MAPPKVFVEDRTNVPPRSSVGLIARIASRPMLVEETSKPTAEPSITMRPASPLALELNSIRTEEPAVKSDAVIGFPVA